jgi:hypothetical protein
MLVRASGAKRQKLMKAVMTKLGVLGVMSLWVVQSVSGATLSAALSQTAVSSLTDEATYGPPPAMAFANGPLTVLSGDSIGLYAGPKPAEAQTGDPADFLFVLSVASGATPTIGFTFSGASGTQTLGAVNFFSTADLGFPALIGGIADGEVNGIKFPDAIHAALRLSDLPLGGVEGVSLGNLVVTTDTDLRIDIFGIGPQGVIVNNTPNSHATGVDVPEPTSAMAAIAAVGMSGLLFRRTRRQA